MTTLQPPCGPGSTEVAPISAGAIQSRRKASPAGSLDGRPQGHEDLKNRGVKVLGIRQIDRSLPAGLKQAEQRLRILDTACPFQKDDIAVQTHAHPISSGISRIMSTLPSPSRVVPTTPGMPARMPDMGLIETSILSANPSTAIPTGSSPTAITTTFKP